MGMNLTLGVWLSCGLLDLALMWHKLENPDNHMYDPLRAHPYGKVILLCVAAMLGPIALVVDVLFQTFIKAILAYYWLKDQRRTLAIWCLKKSNGRVGLWAKMGVLLMRPYLVSAPDADEVLRQIHATEVRHG